MSEEPEQRPGRRFEHRVVPGSNEVITIRVGPNAVCRLSHPESEAESLQLDADSRGDIRLHLSAAADAKPLELLVEETSPEGTTTRHTLSVTADPDHWAVTDRHSDSQRDGAKEELSGDLVPPLLDDPRDLSNAELVNRGYPPRPSADAPAASRERWRQLVSQSYRRVGPERTEHPDVRFTKLEDPETVMSPTLPLPPPSEREVVTRLIRSILPYPKQLADTMFNGSSSTWSGAFLDQPANEFYIVEADWRVPQVYGSPLAHSAAAEWIGMGDGPTDLFQSGTDSESYNLLGWTIAIYWMWIEALPYAPWAVTNFPIDPGDQVRVTIFVADGNGTTWFNEPRGGGLTSRNDSVWFMLYNTTKRLSYWGTYPTVDRGGRFRFVGNTAEFIVERPSSTKSGPQPLANFCVTTMRNCAFGDAQYASKLFPLQPDDGSQPFAANLSYWNMDNPATRHRLATAVSGTDTSSYGGIDVIWVFSNSL
jgi:hypothetical protein